MLCAVMSGLRPKKKTEVLQTPDAVFWLVSDENGHELIQQQKSITQDSGYQRAGILLKDFQLVADLFWI